MTLNLILFFFLAVIAIAAAIGMLLSSNAVYSALFLVLNMATLAVFYLLLGAPFIAMAQVTVYAGAIMVLFLFVIMLLGAERLGGPSTLAWQRPLAFVLALLLVIEGSYIFLFRVPSMPQPAALIEGFGSPGTVGAILFNEYLLPFEVTSVLLLVAMIGAIVLTRRS